MKPQSKKTAAARRGKSPATLRRRAEARLKKKPPAAGGQPFELESQRMLQELQAHRVELELQNEELRKLQAEVETAAARYTVLYDFAPTGYFTLDCEGVIARVNLAGASLLGCARGQLTGRRFEAFVAQADRAALSTLLQQVFQEAAAPACDLTLVNDGQPPRVVRLTAKLAPERTECFVLAEDLTERKQAEARVRQSEAHYRLLAENSSDVIWLLELSTQRLSYVSPSTEKLRGYTVTEMMQQTLPELMTPESYQIVAGTLPARLAAFAAGDDSVRSQTQEIWVPCRDGSVVPTEVVTTLIADEHRQVAQILGVSRDITERKRAELELRRTSGLLEEAQRAARVGYYVNDLSTGQWESSAVLDEIFGIPADYPRDMPGWGRLIHPEDQAAALRQYDLAIHGGGKFRVDYRVIRPSDGQLRWAAGYGQFEYSPEGKPVRLVGCIQDITDRKSAELSLNRLNAQLEQRVQERTAEVLDLYHHAPCGYHSLGPDGVVLQMNDTELGWLGYSRDEVVGRRRLADLMMPASAALFENHFIEFKGQSVPAAMEWDLRCKDGSTMTMLVNAEPVQDQAGRFLHSRSAVVNITERKRTEEALRASEEKFRRLYHSMSEGMALHEVLYDAAGKPVDYVLVSVNPAYEAITGLKAEQVVGRKASELYGTLEAPYLEVYARVIATGRPAHLETWFEPMGKCFRITIFSPGKDQFATVFEDISERKRAEEKLVSIMKAVESTSDAVGISDAQGRHIYQNRAYSELFGYATAEELQAVGGTPATIKNPNVAQELLASIQSGKPWNGELERVTKSGRVFPAFERADAIKDDAGNLIGLVGIITDMTERKQAEAQLRTLQSAVEQSPVVVVITDRDGRIEYVNPSFVAQTGYTAAEAIGQKPSVLKSGLTPPEVYVEMWRTLLAGEIWRGELCNKRKDGSLFWELAAIAPLRDHAGRLTHFVAIKEDITERRRIAEELRQAKEAAESASRAKSVFLANMSHEIRTPMNAILGFAQLMQRDPALTEQQRQWLQTINRSGEHLIRLISDILDMAKIESGRVLLAEEEFDFPALLEDIEAMFRLRVEEKGLRFEIEHAVGIPGLLFSDAGKIRQVLMNLLGNAVKFTEQGSIRLRVTAEPAPPTASGQPEARLCLEVADTGPGIAPEEMDRVFEAFEQVLSHRSASSGTGLGLAISRRLAQLLGGELLATSQVGAGSTFRFTFVARVRAALGGAATSAALARRVIGLKVQGPPPIVLVVDDTESNRSVVRNLLKLVGFVVSEADNGTAAVALCQVERPALVLMDRQMPGLDGLAATRMIRDGLGGQDTRILIVSADTIGTSEEVWRSAGADGFISKPFRYADLLAKIGALLNLDYVYAEPAAPPAHARPVLERSAIAQLPAGLREDLIQATEVGDGARLRELIAQGVSPSQPALGQALGQLAAEYNYRVLLQALREKEL